MTVSKPCERDGYHDAMADRADRDLKEMKLEGTYDAWVKAGRPGRGEWNRRQLEDGAAAARVPYPGYCRTPEKCSGLGSCPADTSCVD